MKPQPYESPYAKQSTRSTKGLLALLALAIAMLAIVLSAAGCATLESIPFSVSYQDDQGHIYTIQKAAIVRATK